MSLSSSATSNETFSAETHGNGDAIALEYHTKRVTSGDLGLTEDGIQGRGETASGEDDLQGEGTLLNPSKKRRASVSNLDEEEGTAKTKLQKSSAAEDVTDALKLILEKHGGNPIDLMKALQKMQGIGLSVPPPLG